MEQFKHLQLPAWVKKHYVKLVAIGIILTILLWMCRNTEQNPPELYIDPVQIDTSRIA